MSTSCIADWLRMDGSRVPPRPSGFSVNIATIKDESFSYSVLTFLGRDKGVAIAARAHGITHPDKIYDVDVTELEEPTDGFELAAFDLGDRMEW
jgi:hypothetical protein